ncbi:hypothetical protein GCM10009613_55540 [Pseudonocardia kongjuensis]|uniref:Methyltransferase type 11 domain-containing protein n=2 Tax=Pseudonocardia kongjuensis TaxID=102227 RepID=A0ABP4IVL0_9PSEU
MRRMVDRGELVEHYATADEQGRLTGGTSLERLRTQLLLRRALPAAPSRILDVGGGAGVHAAWLAELGHSVHLVDAVPEHVEQARSAGTFTAALGDAVELAEADHSYDAVLLLGPLYHLRRRSERIQALREAHRVTRAGGVLAAAAISRYASMMDGFYRGFVADPAFVEIVVRDLETGRHDNPTRHPRYFTSSYFHTCAELRAEIAAAGYRLVDLLPVEGVLAWYPGLDEQMSDPVRRDLVLRCIERTEHDPAVTAASPHLLALASV